MGEILFLAHRVPFPPNRGDKIRAHHLLKRLARIAPVHVGCLAESDEDRRAITQLQELAASYCAPNRTKPLALAGVEAVLSGKPVSLTAFHNPKLAQWVKSTVVERNISTVVIFSGQMGQYVSEDFGGRLLVDLCDVDSAKFENYAAAGQRVWINAREARLLARDEGRLANRADATILISEAEANLFESRLSVGHSANIHVIGNGIDAGLFDPDIVTALAEITQRPGPHFVFTGQMDYQPNEAAALWVIRQLLPAFRKAHAGAEFHVVGRNPTSALLGYNSHPGVTIWGEVPDVRPFLKAADAVLAPLSIARGVQNKVLEAMAMSQPVVLTPEAATGIAALDGQDWLLSPRDVTSFCERMDMLIGESSHAAEIGRAGRRFVLDHHDWDAMLAPLERLITFPNAEKRDAA